MHNECDMTREEIQTEIDFYEMKTARALDWAGHNSAYGKVEDQVNHYLGKQDEYEQMLEDLVEVE